jgi:plastocyanin
MSFRRAYLAHAAIALAIGLATTNALAADASATVSVSATVSFGQWMSSPPLDRFPNFGGSPTTNVHALIPNVVTIKAGGSVNFIVSGLHNIAIYDDGVQPIEINIALTTPTTSPDPPVLPIINDPNRRIYRGVDPTLQARDRVEVVNFSKPGTYLVICGVLPHFQEGMYGYVRVLP